MPSKATKKIQSSDTLSMLETHKSKTIKRKRLFLSSKLRWKTSIKMRTSKEKRSEDWRETGRVLTVGSRGREGEWEHLDPHLKALILSSKWRDWRRERWDFSQETGCFRKSMWWKPEKQKLSVTFGGTFPLIFLLVFYG